jgi:hypothetical protein
MTARIAAQSRDDVRVTLPLTELLAAADLDEVDHYLRTVEGQERAEAKAWFEGTRRWFRTFINTSFDGWGGGGLERANSLHWLEGLCAVALCGPVTAAKRMPWSDIWDYQEFPGEAVFVHRLWDADPAWAADFVSAASEVNLGSDARNCNENLSRVLRAVVLHHGLPAPAGATFHGAWLAPGERRFPPTNKDATAVDAILGLLRHDPLMPDLLYHFLASGHAGTEPALPAATATMVEEGLVDRARVLSVVLEQLTGRQRVAGQRVLAALVQAIGLASAEIPGGISYLTGVLATSDGSVGLVLLPMAVELVTNADELSELVTVIASRPERKQKELLLRALQGEPLRERVADAGLAAALNLLAADEDAALRTKVATVLESLGHAPSAVTSAATGLWQMEPQPGPPTNDWWWRDRSTEPQTCLRVLSNDPRYGSGDVPGVLAWGLRQILLGNLPVRQIVADARVLLATGQLSLPRTAQLFEELFLSGGMCLTWAAAVEVAEAACGMKPRPGGLVVLLRMLATYAPEAPSQVLPPKLSQFAAATGNSKAQQELRSLGAVLAGSSVADFRSQLRHQPSSPETRQHQGLWSADRTDAWLVSARLDPARNIPLDQLVTRVAEDRRGDYGWGGESNTPSGFTASSLLLHDLLVAVERCGADAVRQSLRRINLPVGWAGPVRLAADLWAADVLTISTYWRLALTAGTGRDADSHMGQLWDDLWGARLEAGPSGPADPEFTGQMSARFEGPGVQFLFLLACECLLLAGRAPAPLSTPSYDDGSLNLEDLIARLRRRESGTVGPLDLLQSLYRLRPIDPLRTADLAGLSLSTAAELSSPDGVALDIVPTLRSWLAQGGLPDVVAVPSDSAQPSWRFDAEQRVQLPWLDAAFGGLPALATKSGLATRAIIFPLWPDVLLGPPFGETTRPEPGYLTCIASRSGKLGVPAHDYLLASLSQPSGTGRALAVPILIRLAQQDRLNAESAVQAALGRWGAGTMELARSIPCWEQVLLGGGFRGAWAPILAIADAGCSLSPRPTALAGLLSMLADYGHGVPDPVVPPHISNLAGEKASTRGQIEARALVAALTRSGPTP